MSTTEGLAAPLQGLAESERTLSRSVHYDVKDLAPTQPATLATWVREFVEPTSWAEAGGQGSVTAGSPPTSTYSSNGIASISAASPDVTSADLGGRSQR